jgi:hypothetical protein
MEMQATETIYLLLIVQFTQLKSNERKARFIQNGHSCFLLPTSQFKYCPQDVSNIQLLQNHAKSGKC